jgi:hypothetical protein
MFYCFALSVSKGNSNLHMLAFDGIIEKWEYKIGFSPVSMSTI